MVNIGNNEVFLTARLIKRYKIYTSVSPCVILNGRERERYQPATFIIHFAMKRERERKRERVVVNI